MWYDAPLDCSHEIVFSVEFLSTALWVLYCSKPNVGIGNLNVKEQLLLYISQLFRGGSLSGELWPFTMKIQLAWVESTSWLSFN